MKTNETLYLKSLNLQNFATFENQEIQFDIKFNAIVGETGSGKSLILDALQIIFGARADKKLIRKNAEFATIEAVFSSNDPIIKKYFHDIGHPFEGSDIVVKRIIFANESSKSYLNFQSCSASLLVAFSKRFVDLVGQFENQKLMSEDYQLVLLDSYSGLSQDIRDYQAL
ncbi:MAG: AAA family ATPase, partial [Bdellovibrionales bacterium]|nr:AAA family ATPase [Bdellovibrionales bacterium]